MGLCVCVIGEAYSNFRLPWLLFPIGPFHVSPAYSCRPLQPGICGDSGLCSNSYSHWEMLKMWGQASLPTPPPQAVLPVKSLASPLVCCLPQLLRLTEPLAIYVCLPQRSPLYPTLFHIKWSPLAEVTKLLVFSACPALIELLCWQSQGWKWEQLLARVLYTHTVPPGLQYFSWSVCAFQ